MEAKAELRRELARRRAAISGRAARSQQVATRVLSLPAFQQATAIHCYLPIRSEVDTLPLLEAAFASGKRVILPVVESHWLTIH